MSCLQVRGGSKRVRRAVLVDAAVLELDETRMDALGLGDIQARVLARVEGLDVLNEDCVLFLPRTTRRALALGERVRLRRLAEGATRRVLELELVAILLPHDVVLETGGDSSHLDALRTRRASGAL